ncbi:MAG: S24 family peptidase [Acidobacteriota bacterium]|nr:S24 family peptidase [Acidobacteriota bacterium]
MDKFKSVAFDLTQPPVALPLFRQPEAPRREVGGCEVVTRPPAADRFKTCVPLVDIAAAAGAFSESQDTGLACLLEAEDWLTLPEGKAQPGRFAARVVGRSMEPMIPDGSTCLFGPVRGGSKNGLPLLILLHDQTDPEHGGRYTVKIYRSEKVEAEDGALLNTRVILEPKNPEFEAMVFREEDAEGLRAIGRFLEVLAFAGE